MAATPTIPQVGTHPSHTSAIENTLNNQQVSVLSQYQPLHVMITLPRRSFLTSENIEVSVSTNVSGTKIELYYEIDGERTSITGATIYSNESLSFKTPEKTGQIRLVCEANALITYVDICNGEYFCGYDSYGSPTFCPYSYPCLKETIVYDTAVTEFRNYSRIISISGTIYDTLQNPINEATVSLSNGMSQTSSIEGSYRFDNFMIGDNYYLSGGRPTVTATITANAVACRQQVQTIQIMAEQPLNGVDISLNRIFYLPHINPTYFTFSAFDGWPEARSVATWEDILAITSSENAKIFNINYGSSGLTNMPAHFKSFVISGQNVVLLPNPGTGRYRLDFSVDPSGHFYVYAAANLKGSISLKEIQAIGKGEKPMEKLSLKVSHTSLELGSIEILDPLIVILIAIAGIIAGFVVTFFILGRQYGWTYKMKDTMGSLISKTPTAALKQPSEGKLPDQNIRLEAIANTKQLKEESESNATEPDTPKAKGAA